MCDMDLVMLSNVRLMAGGPWLEDGASLQVLRERVGGWVIRFGTDVAAGRLRETHCSCLPGAAKAVGMEVRLMPG
jgi:hypothetical protein